MKRTLLLAGVLAAGLAANAQVQRMVLAEGFSNASCGPCAAQNPAYNTLLGSNTTKVIAIKYQTNWPGVDPMNAQTQSQVVNRVNYYAVSGVPYGRLDGVEYAGPNYAGALANLDQTEIDTRYAVTSPFSLTASHSFSSDYDSIFISVVATTPAAFSGTTMKLHVNLVEKEIDFVSPPGTNGETVFHNVFRDSYTTTNGQTIPNSWAAAESHTYTFARAIPSYIYDITQLSIITFIQDDSNKDVKQAALSAPIAVNNYGLAQNIGNLPALSCSPDFNGVTVQLNNIGGNTITSATVNYQIDGGTTQTAPFSGSIATGGSTPFTLPNISGVAAGAHTIDVWMSNINNAGISTASTSYDFTNITSATGSMAPVVNNFSNAAFPYANWALVNPDPNYSWLRVATNTGSMKFNNFNFASGTISNFVVEPVNLTGMNNAYLNFDVAYCQYASENDRLEVYVSTDCGTNWTSVYNKAGATLATKAAQTGAFTPTAAQWRTEQVDLSSYTSASKLFIKYKATSAYGNNLYVDNINISATGSAGIEDVTSTKFVVYPNPATDYVNVTFDNVESINITMINSVGQTVRVFNNVSNNAVLNLEGLSSGVYILNADVNGQRITKQIIKN